MAARARILGGLVNQAEEDVNELLSTHEVRSLYLAQGESGDPISVELIFEEPEALPDDGY